MGDPCNHAVVGVLTEWNGRYLTGVLPRARRAAIGGPLAGRDPAPMTACDSCGAPKSVTKVYDPATGKVRKKIVNPCRRCP